MHFSAWRIAVHVNEFFHTCNVKNWCFVFIVCGWLGWQQPTSHDTHLSIASQRVLHTTQHAGLAHLICTNLQHEPTMWPIYRSITQQITRYKQHLCESGFMQNLVQPQCGRGRVSHTFQYCTQLPSCFSLSTRFFCTRMMQMFCWQGNLR